MWFRCCENRAGFTGGLVVDYPNSSKAKKYYLCLSFEHGYKTPAAKTTEQGGTAATFEVRASLLLASPGPRCPSRPPSSRARHFCRSEICCFSGKLAPLSSVLHRSRQLLHYNSVWVHGLLLLAGLQACRLNSAVDDQSPWPTGRPKCIALFGQQAHAPHLQMLNIAGVFALSVFLVEKQAGNRERRGPRGKASKVSAAKSRNWVLAKKDRQRRQGKDVRADSKFTGRKRKDKF